MFRLANRLPICSLTSSILAPSSTTPNFVRFRRFGPPNYRVKLTYTSPNDDKTKSISVENPYDILDQSENFDNDDPFMRFKQDKKRRNLDEDINKRNPYDDVNSEPSAPLIPESIEQEPTAHVFQILDRTYFVHIKSGGIEPFLVVFGEIDKSGRKKGDVWLSIPATIKVLEHLHQIEKIVNDHERGDFKMNRDFSGALYKKAFVEEDMEYKVDLMCQTQPDGYVSLNVGVWQENKANRKRSYLMFYAKGTTTVRDSLEEALRILHDFIIPCYTSDKHE